MIKKSFDSEKIQNFVYSSLFIHFAFLIILGRDGFMAGTSTPSNCIECGKMNKMVNRKKKINFLLPTRAIILPVFLFLFILFVFPSWGQEEIEKTSIARKENKESRPKKQTAILNQEQEIQDSAKKIPWDSLSPQTKSKVNHVVSEHSLFHRMPQQKIYADPEMFQFFSEHPDLVVGFWEKLGVTQISLQELNKNQFLMKETTGTTAVAEVVYRTKDICIVYAKGLYKGPFLVRSYDGEAVLILRNRFMRDVNNEPIIICDLDVFVRIDHLGVDFLAKLFATTLGKIADSNFEQTVSFVGYVSESAGINAESVKRNGYQVKNVRETVREDFGDVVDRVAMRIARRNHRNFPENFNFETETYPIPTDAPFTQKQIYQTQQTDNSTFLAVSSEKLKQEFDETFQSDPFFVVHNSLEEKKEETILPRSTGLKQHEELPSPIPVGLSTWNNSAFDDKEIKTDYNNTIPQKRAIFKTPKISR
ncbi:MAG: hypothetical protein LBL62_00915 [Planctomycetaceae bacterium]|jgi:hypothetical protein|nr:hypothetical protein [Planctomycetaceae bacterium]